MRVKEGLQPFRWAVSEPATLECPVSAITPRSIELVQIVTTLTVTHGATGSTIPVSDLPGYLVDAIRVCENESRIIDSAMEDAR